VLLDAGSIPAASTINKMPPQGGFLLMVQFSTRTRGTRGEGRVAVRMCAAAADTRRQARRPGDSRRIQYVLFALN
jgi:hypothetical protein